MRKLANIIVGFVILVTVWQLIIWIGGYNESLFPPPLNVWNALVELFLDGTLFVHLQVSLYRFLVGYLLAVLAGVVLGLILGRIPAIWAVIDPIVQVLRPVAPIAWSPIIILWFNLGSASAIVIIFIAAFYPMLLTTVSAVRKVDPVYLRVAQNFEIKRRHLILKVIFPAAFPQITHGLHLALGIAWIFLVSGEMIGAQSGLGYLIVDGRNLLRLDYVFVAIIVIGVAGVVLDKIISVFERWVEKQWGH